LRQGTIDDARDRAGDDAREDTGATGAGAVTGIVLCGGLNRRFGSDKCEARVGGRRIVEVVVETIRAAFGGEVLAAGCENPPVDGVRAVADIYHGKGPLAGLHSGLSASTTAKAFVTACDMPFLKRAFLRYMASHAHGCDVLVPVSDGFYEPLHAIYDRRCLPHIERALHGTGVPRVKCFFDDVLVKIVPEVDVRRFGDPRVMFFNVNEPSDLQKARLIAERRYPGSGPGGS